MRSCSASNVIEAMGAAINHRGPDAASHHIDAQIALRHQRLSILDTSEHGLQPMRSHSGRYVIVYNGEIYNFQPLRSELESLGHEFRGGSDTEVLLELYERYGVECLAMLNGMFAFAIWDCQQHVLFLARDRLGKKPLYYYQEGDKFIFASEIKAILEVPGVDRSIRYDAVKDFFTHQYVPDPKSIFSKIHKLPPAHWMRVSASGVTLAPYWNVSFAKQRSGSVDDLSAELLELLDDSVRIRMISDVPLGAFLSGGVDSSGVVGLMAKNSASPVTTCSIGFDEQTHDETVYAAEVAELFSTEHHKHTVTGNTLDSLVEVSRFFDEPFADSSFLPTYMVSKVARQRVTVALAGDGGDENFAGYSKYKADRMERSLRRRMGVLGNNTMTMALGQMLANTRVGPMQRAGNLLSSIGASPDRGFFMCNSFFRVGLWDQLVRGDLKRATDDYDPASASLAHYADADTDDHLASTLYVDLKTYLAGDILVKVDRMSMANSLECRAPILDYRIVEFAASLPSDLKLNGDESKYLLKEAFSRLLPESVLYRKKMGFASPVAQWLRTTLRPLFESLVFDQNSASAQFFNDSLLQSMWQRHLGGSNACTQELWSILSFELWWDHYIKD